MQLLNLLFLSMSLNSYNFQNHKITVPGNVGHEYKATARHRYQGLPH